MLNVRHRCPLLWWLYAWNSTSLAPTCLLHLQVSLADILRLSIYYFILSEMAQKPLFLVEMQVIVRFGFHNSPCSWKQRLRFVRVEVQSLGTWFSCVVCLTSNWGQMREIGWVSNCHFLQLSDGQVLRLVISSRNIWWWVCWNLSLRGGNLNCLGTILTFF